MSDRDAAAAWYARVLGLRRHPGLGVWADDPMGPLILQAGDGEPALSLFARDRKPVMRDATIAFRVDGAGFIAFCDRLEALELRDRSGAALTRAAVVDHDLSWSIYFVDPDDNRIEVTSYDYEEVRDALG